ncbi:SpoIIE family protein phosphatase [Streptomyces sp. NPDC000410]|uniref:SpoIIE family protein phosphatase n=1 Tax=Streptomyces sp. NPDC000410 TaxID=3154254 RepID=UPI00331B27CD
MAADRRDRLQGRRALRTPEADGPGTWSLEDALRGASAGIAVLGTDLRYLFANSAYCRITGEAPAGLVGRPPSDRAGQYIGPASLPGEVLDDGVPRSHVTGPGSSSRCTCVRLENRGTVTGVLCIVVETSVPELYEELELARARLAAADEAVERIGTTLDEGATCYELAEFLGSRLADAVAVDLLPAPPPGGSPKALAAPAAMRRAAVAGPVRLLGDDADRRHPAPSAVARAVATGLPATEHGAGAVVLAVPLAPPGGRGRLLGVVLLARTHSAFTANDTRIAQHAARRAAVGIAHAREFAAEQHMAVELQRALLTEPGKPHPNLELATRYLPSGTSSLVGGDWFETVRLHYGRTLLVMGDVMGHGVEAAVEMNTYRAMLRDVAAADLPPHRVLRQLDLAIADTSARPATCLLVRMDPARSLASFSSAGHLPPVVFARDGTAELIDVPAGPPLGTGFGGYELVTRELTTDDTLLLYTDGLVERRGEDIDASLARLTRVRLPPGTAVEGLADEVLRVLDADAAEDDVALLAARIRSRRRADHVAEEHPVPGRQD